MIKYKEVFSPIRGIATNLNTPQNAGIDKNYLNTILFSNIGERTLTPLVYNYLSKDDIPYYITDEHLLELTNIINMCYNQKWQKDFDALSFAYNVGDNYKREERETISLEGEENLQGQENTQNKVYGFDSENAVNDKSDVVTSTNANTNTSDKERNLLVTGNMSGGSYQSLIREELRLRENLLINIIFSDIKKMVVLPIY